MDYRNLNEDFSNQKNSFTGEWVKMGYKLLKGQMQDVFCEMLFFGRASVCVTAGVTARSTGAKWLM